MRRTLGVNLHFCRYCVYIILLLSAAGRGKGELTADVLDIESDMASIVNYQTPTYVLGRIEYGACYAEQARKEERLYFPSCVETGHSKIENGAIASFTISVRLRGPFRIEMGNTESRYSRL